MRVLITGMRGTIAPVLGRRFAAEGWEVIPWDRAAVRPEDGDRCRAFLEDTNADAVAHLALGDPGWAGLLAGWAGERGGAFLFTSTVSVWADRPSGPLTVDTPVDGSSEYARYKQECEQRVGDANPAGTIARLGWQIGERRGGNTMTEFLAQRHESGGIDASRMWYPACSFLADTAQALFHLIDGKQAGTYLIDSNVESSFFEIAVGLGNRLGTSWHIEATEEPVLDLRMVDDRVAMPSIDQRLRG